MDELEVTSCPHCGAEITGLGMLSASGRYCKRCINKVIDDVRMTYVKQNKKQSNVIAYIVSGNEKAVYVKDAETIFDVIEENEPDLLSDFVREYVSDFDADYTEWLLEEF